MKIAFRITIVIALVGLFFIFATVHRTFMVDHGTTVVVTNDPDTYRDQVALLAAFDVKPDFEPSGDGVLRSLYFGGELIVNFDRQALATGGTFMVPSTDTGMDTFRAVAVLKDMGYKEPLTRLVMENGEPIRIVAGKRGDQVISIGFRPNPRKLSTSDTPVGTMLWRKIWG